MIKIEKNRIRDQINRNKNRIKGMKNLVKFCKLVLRSVKTLNLTSVFQKYRFLTIKKMIRLTSY